MSSASRELGLATQSLRPCAASAQPEAPPTGPLRSGLFVFVLARHHDPQHVHVARTEAEVSSSFLHAVATSDRGAYATRAARRSIQNAISSKQPRLSTRLSPSIGVAVTNRISDCHAYGARLRNGPISPQCLIGTYSTGP